MTKESIPEIETILEVSNGILTPNDYSILEKILKKVNDNISVCNYKSTNCANMNIHCRLCVRDNRFLHEKRIDLYNK